MSIGIRSKNDGSTMGPSILGWVSCICLVFTAVLVCFCLEQVAPLLDQHLAPGQVPIRDARSFTQRLHNTFEMPQACETIVPTDVVANVSVATGCVAWCHESLGPASALPYAFSPRHWFHLRHTSPMVQRSFAMCWKAETAACALSWFPSAWHMYVFALMYGSISGFALLRALWEKNRLLAKRDVEDCTFGPSTSASDPAKISRDTSEEDEQSSMVSSESGSDVRGPQTDGFLDDGSFVSPFLATQRCKMPFCCIAIDSDLQGSKCELRLSAFLMLFEPSLDVLSVMIFLRSGQPIYAAIVGLATLLSWIPSCDPFQIHGASAMAESFAQGFPTKGLLRHRKRELIESAGATIVQCYALLSMDIASASLSNSCTLTASASLSLALSLPDTCKAVGVLVEGTAHDYYAAEQSKQRLGFFGRYIVTFLCMMFAEIAFVLKGKQFDTQFTSLWLEPSKIPWSHERAWELWFIALILLCFRSAALAALPLAFCGLLLSIHQGWISSVCN